MSYRIFSILLLSLWLSSCSMPSETSDPAIVGGRIPDAASPVATSTVALVKRSGQALSTVCSGSLIAPNLVLTAAHCLETNRTALEVLFSPSDQTQHPVSIAIESYQSFKKDGSRFFPNFDIAWVKLKHAAPNTHKPIEILRRPDAFDELAGRPQGIRLAGYGRVASLCSGSDCMGRLFEVDTVIKHFFNAAHFVNLLVIGPNPGFGTCNGDSGGPALVQHHGRWLLAGVLNGKSPLLNSPNLWQEGVCESGEAIYNFPGAYVDWIQASSGVKLSFDEGSNPGATAIEALHNADRLPNPPSLVDYIAYNNHHDPLWAAVEALVANFRDPKNRFGQEMEELASRPELAAAAMLRWQEFDHTGVRYDFVTLSTKVNQLETVAPLGLLHNLRSLTLDSNAIKDTAPLAQLQQLEDLSLHNNYDVKTWKHIDWDFAFLAQLPKLRRLDLSGNHENLNLRDVPWASLTQLEELQLSDNARTIDLSAVPWERLPQLSKLTIRNSQLFSINGLERATSLEELDLSRNNLISIRPLASLPKLRVLDLSMNEIQDFSPLASLTELVQLQALSNIQNSEVCPINAHCVYSPAHFSDFESYCRFAFTLPPEDLPHWSGGATVMRLIQISGLEALRLDGCAEAQTKLMTLETLDLSGGPTGQRIEDLRPLGPLTGLKALNLSNNDLRDLRPLSGLQELHTLDLSQNSVSDIWPLAKLSKLQVLNIEGNLVDSLQPLHDLVGLSVFARGNPLDDMFCPIQNGYCDMDDMR